jgi:hypothetical protein
MNCGACSHWSFKDSPLKDFGFGLCRVEPDAAMRAARTMSARCACRHGRFVKASPATIAKREAALCAKVCAE